MFKFIKKIFVFEGKEKRATKLYDGHPNHAVYAANKTFFTGYRWSCAYDTSTCLYCATLSGLFFETLDEALLIELKKNCTSHHGCRCLLQPQIKTWRELGIDMDDRPITTHGQYATFEDYWHNLPPDLQNEITGRTRGGLLRAGKIRWHDLLNTTTYKLYTLRELGFDMDEPSEEDYFPDEEACLERFKKLPVIEQNKIAGVTKATLLKSGKLKWNEAFDPKISSLLQTILKENHEKLNFHVHVMSLALPLSKSYYPMTISLKNGFAVGVHIKK